MGELYKEDSTGLLKTPIFLLVMSIVFSFYYIDFGFALKPFMILSILVFVLSLKSFVIHKLRLFEVMLFIFFFYYCLTGLFAEYPEYSLRMILGVLLVLFCYIVMRYLMSKNSVKLIEKSIAIGGLVFNGLSLLLYLIGISSLGFVLAGNQIKEYGVMMDRGFPRLIGLASDPNIFCFYNFIFFFYYLTHLDRKWSKFGLLVSSAALMLTMSRGGLLSVAFGLLLLFFSLDLRKKIKLLFVMPVMFFMFNLIVKTVLKINIIGMIIDRFSDDGGGSGRSEIWGKGLRFFQENPIFGIGIFNYRPYSDHTYGYSIYMHNSYLEALVEGGVIGMFLYSLIFIIVFITYLNYKTLINDRGYLLFTFAAVSLMMGTYSFMINEIFFLVIALIWRYLLDIDKAKLEQTVR